LQTLVIFWVCNWISLTTLNVFFTFAGCLRNVYLSNLFTFLLLSYKSCLYILDIKFLSQDLKLKLFTKSNDQAPRE
jgi:hypothetical protein